MLASWGQTAHFIGNGATIDVTPGRWCHPALLPFIDDAGDLTFERPTGSFAWRRNVESHNREHNLPVRVVRLCEDVTECAFIRFPKVTLELWMLRGYLGNLRQDRAETRVPVEDYHGGLRVPPAQI